MPARCGSWPSSLPWALCRSESISVAAGLSLPSPSPPGAALSSQLRQHLQRAGDPQGIRRSEHGPVVAAMANIRGCGSIHPGHRAAFPLWPRHPEPPSHQVIIAVACLDRRDIMHLMRQGASPRAGCYAQERAEPKASPPIRVTPPYALCPPTGGACSAAAGFL